MSLIQMSIKYKLPVDLIIELKNSQVGINQTFG